MQYASHSNLFLARDHQPSFFPPLPHPHHHCAFGHPHIYLYILNFVHIGFLLILANRLYIMLFIGHVCSASSTTTLVDILLRRYMHIMVSSLSLVGCGPVKAGPFLYRPRKDLLRRYFEVFTPSLYLYSLIFAYNRAKLRLFACATIQNITGSKET